MRKKAISGFLLKGSVSYQIMRVYHNLGFREVVLLFVEKDLEEDFGLLEVCPKFFMLDYW